MRQMLRDLLWIYAGIGQPPGGEFDRASFPQAWQGFVGLAWAIVTGAGITSVCLCLALTPQIALELAISCPAGRIPLLCLLLAGSPLAGLPRFGLELAKAADCCVSAARLCVVAASASWWTLTALVALFVFFPISR
jgi:hypothetical protein